jgi:hypothetical protein
MREPYPMLCLMIPVTRAEIFNFLLETTFMGSYLNLDIDLRIVSQHELALG